jgi:hypothetical protein
VRCSRQRGRGTSEFQLKGLPTIRQIDRQALDYLSVVDQNIWPPNNDSPWNAVSAQDLPSVTSAIWPGALKFGRNMFWNRLGGLAWAWIILIGGLMITPGGVECIVCGPQLTRVLGIVSIALGVLGLISRAIVGRTAATQRVARPQVDLKGDIADFLSHQCPSR